MSLKHLTLALTLSGIGVLAGCSSPNVIQKSDGSQVITPDTPEYNKKSGMYEYDQDGRKVQINKDDVKTIEEIKN